MEKFFFERLVPLWGKWYGGILVGLFAAGFTFFSSIESLNDISATDWLIAGLVLMAFVVARELTNPKKRNPKGQVGICVALKAESDAEHSKIQHKLIESLKRKLKRNIEGNHINLVCLSNQECAEIDGVQSLSKQLKGTRSHMIIFGRVVTGNVNGTPMTSLHLDVGVIHGSRDANNQALLSKEMRLGFPKEALVNMQNDLREFEFLSTQFDFVAKYIIAIAAFISGDFEYAAKLMISLEQSGKEIQEKSPALTYFIGILPERIAQINRHRLFLHYRRYVKSRESSELLLGKALTDDLLRRDADDYMALLYKSMLVFLIEKDVSAAIGVLARCQKQRDATWMYNYAFLLAYEGKLWEAHSMYRRAFAATTHLGNAPVESEEFILTVLDSEPHQTHLHFAIALINYNAKKDFGLAAEAFEYFLAIQNAESAWPEAFALSQKLLTRSVSRAR